MTDERISLAPAANTDDVLARLEAAACRILRALPHTPVRAVGLNFDFDEVQPDPKLAALFRLTDTGTLADNGFVMEQTDLVRRLVGQQGDILKLRLRLKDGAVSFMFNFHYDVPDATTALGRVENCLLAKRNESVDLMRRLYGLEQGVTE